MPPPTQAPWIAAITGLRQRSIEVRVSCRSRIRRRSFSRAPVAVIAHLRLHPSEHSRAGPTSERPPMEMAAVEEAFKTHGH